MNSWKVILATMVIFGTGVLTGGLLVKHTSGPARIRPRNLPVTTNTPPPNIIPGQLQRMDFLRRVGDQLNLTPDQHERIGRIIHEGQERSRKIWDGVAPEMRKELQTVHDRIRAELTPDQRRRFEELLKRAPRPNAAPPEGGQPLPPERMRERLRQGAPGEPQPNPGQVRPTRRENVPATGSLPPRAAESLPPRKDDSRPSPAEPQQP